jgi:hypothetical protein
MKKFTLVLLAVSIANILPSVAFADIEHQQHTLTPETHAPIGVMGDHMHNAGEFMFSYRLMMMEMSGLIQGSDNVSSDHVATTVANPYANPPMSPPTVRVVPQDMTRLMHMIGFMYAPTDDLTLMAMVNYIDNDMELTTYQGGMGTNTLGNFNTQSSGIADSKLGVLYRVYDSETHHFHFNATWQIPLGSIDEAEEVLTPMNTKVMLRLPYSMQLGSGSNMLELGGTYNGYGEKSNWGSQLLYKKALERNDEHYRWGDKLNLTAWYAYRVMDNISMSVRLNYIDQDDIEGIDIQIKAPVSTANPENYGGQYLDLAIGMNTTIANKHRVAFEYQVPVDYDVNGVQLKMDEMLTLGYQLAF